MINVISIRQWCSRGRTAWRRARLYINISHRVTYSTAVDYSSLQPYTSYGSDVDEAALYKVYEVSSTLYYNYIYTRYKYPLFRWFDWCMWSFSSVSWKLCECMSNLCFWLINSSFLSPWWSIKSSTRPRPVPGSHLIICEVSALYLENCANACRIYVFWVINLLFLTPPGYGRIVNHSLTCTVESLTYLWSFNSISWKLCECTLN